MSNLDEITQLIIAISTLIAAIAAAYSSYYNNKAIRRVENVTNTMHDNLMITKGYEAAVKDEKERNKDTME